MSPSTLISAALDDTLICHDVELWQPVAVGRCVTQCSETCKHCIMFTSLAHSMVLLLLHKVLQNTVCESSLGGERLQEMHTKNFI